MLIILLLCPVLLRSPELVLSYHLPHQNLKCIEHGEYLMIILIVF